MNDQVQTKYSYRISPLRRAIIGIPFVLLVLGFLILGAAFREESLLFVGALVALITAPFGLLILYTRLRLSSSGVELRQFGYTLQSPWDNVEAVELAAGIQGFILTKPIGTAAAKRLRSASELTIVSNGAALSPYMGGHRELVAQGRFIPIEAFGYWFRHGDLQQVIQRFAPHVNFVTTPAAPPLPLKNKMLIIGLVGLGVALGLVMACDIVPLQIRDRIGTALVCIQASALAVVGGCGLISSILLFAKRRWMIALVSLLFATITLLVALSNLAESI